ncbi:conserved hypothetical Ustilaginaceae-specific protein [Sporisorium reilianum SRZ2]|uniref:Conserved hypothetical Ustilaginaceae-specific protein n=1 Tax=Sporisorium reilianum (strain SRZ2) TaxID=999809 RepID=E6ZT13_SPORE|nr:conserved hypothetical Ustilaginaceae-specific protein [Sporisorium reilianum SRZ2]
MSRPFNATLPVDLLPTATGDNNVDISQLLNFLTQIAQPQITQSTVYQLYVCMAIILLLGVMGTAMILQRLIRGRAWFLKLWHVGGGAFVIPNAVIVFLGCEACFGFNWIIYAFVTIRHYQVHTFQTPYFVYKALTFCPLWVGAWWTAFGVTGAFPDSLTRKTKDSKQKRLIVSPSVFNVACWGMPVVQMGSLLSPAILAARRNAAAATEFDGWSEDVRAALVGSVDVGAYEELHARAMDIWLKVTEAYWFYSVTMLCWLAWAILALVVYVPMGGHVLLRIRRKLQVERRKIEEASGRPTPATLECAINYTLDPQDTQQGKDRFGTATSRVFPPLRESAFQRRKSMQTLRTPEERRLRNLQRLLINLAVQYFGISVAIFCFIAAAAETALKMYDAAQYNYLMRIEVQTNLFAAWSMVFFASLIFCCIFQRSFDPSLSFDVSEEEPMPLAPRSTLIMLFRPCLGSRTTPERGDKDEAAREVPSLEKLRPRRLSMGGTSFGQSSASGAIASDDENKARSFVSATTPQAATFDVSPTLAQTVTFDLSPCSPGTPKGSSDNTLDTCSSTIEIYYASTPPGKVTASSGVTLPESPLHDAFRLADPTPHQCAAPPRARDQELEIAPPQPTVLGESRPVRKASVQSLRPRSNTCSQKLNLVPRRPATSSEGTGSFGRAPLLDMEAKCFVPPSRVEGGSGQTRTES